MKYLVIGAKGLLGEAFTRLLKESQCDVRSLSRDEVDLADGTHLARHLRNCEFDVLLNCEGMTGLEQCLDQPDLATSINAKAPQIMAEECASRSAKMVHFSTDYVFDGEQEGWCDESSGTNPINHYGVTKLEGECAVMHAHPSAIVARVSWIFGPGRKTFVDQVLRQMTAEDWPGTYISDKYSVPNYSDDLVKMCTHLLGEGFSGLVHLTSTGPQVSWLQYAQEVISAAEELGLVSAKISAPRSSKMVDIEAFRARRPRWTAMRSTRLVSSGLEVPDWRVGLRSYLKGLKRVEGNR